MKTRDDTECMLCHKTIEQHPRGRERKFCSDKCRNTYWAFYRDDMNHRPDTAREYECAHCGKKFTVYYIKKRKYCSQECYRKHRFGV